MTHLLFRQGETGWPGVRGPDGAPGRGIPGDKVIDYTCSYCRTSDWEGVFEAPIRPGHEAAGSPPITGSQVLLLAPQQSISSSYAVTSASVRSVSICPQGDRGDRGPRGTIGSPGPVGPAGAKVPSSRTMISVRYLELTGNIESNLIQTIDPK